MTQFNFNSFTYSHCRVPKNEKVDKDVESASFGLEHHIDIESVMTIKYPIKSKEWSNKESGSNNSADEDRGIILSWQIHGKDQFNPNMSW